MRRHARSIDRAARRVVGMWRLGMDHSDVVGDLTVALLESARAYSDRTGGNEPSAAFAGQAIRWARYKIYRRFTSRNAAPGSAIVVVSYPLAYQSHDGGIDHSEIADDGADLGDAVAERSDIDALCEGLVYALERDMTPAEFGLIYLRCVEGVSIKVIAGVAGVGPGTIEKRTRVAKDTARQLLAVLGVNSIDKADDIGIGDLDATEIDCVGKRRRHPDHG